MSTRVSSSQSFRSRRVDVPASVFRVHPRNSLAQVLPPSPVRSFFSLIESLESPGKDGKIHLRAKNVPSKTQCWRSALPCTAEMMSSIQQSIWEKISLVCGGGGQVAGILEMVP